MTDKPSGRRKTTQKYSVPDKQPYTVPYSKTILPNGVRIVSEEVPDARSFALGIWIDVGSRDETPSEQGIAHFIEHVIFRGTGNRSSRQIANELESMGGYVNAFTTKDHTCIYVRALTQHFPRLLALLSDMTLRPSFRPVDIEKERSIILEEVKSIDDEPEEMVMDYLEGSLFGTHPLAHPITGTVHTLGAITHEQILAFHRKNYHGRNLVFSVAGNIPHDYICTAVQRLTDALPVATARRRLAPKIRPARELRLHKPIQQAHLALGALTPGVQSDTYYTFIVLNMLLGEGMSSRLNQSIRERHGIAYSVYSSLSEMRDCSIMTMYAAMEPGNLARTEKLIEKELIVLNAKEVGATELCRAKEQVKSQLIMSFESMSGRMHSLARNELYMGEHEEIAQTLAAIDAVTSADILAIVRQYLTQDKWHKAILLPA